jgi:hypothetical protein
MVISAVGEPQMTAKDKNGKVLSKIFAKVKPFPTTFDVVVHIA